ncbi:S-layer homology domain-containing protein [Acidaminobacter hydrogenoformans]|uniref:S-layer homology domain-containing protein n=1 Tax=Acidaminobacter hydrogenoformans DSM 2784 TaxID=1120920 RepID=A0A1G5RQL3_9FIRM|nr:S-layer homology domain-containing protein [Acidaminobacter hydrogenoformans]SCZ76382.1 S-layer homology domain-containing protein [Acidaminobacter hydrogenoformans DSM 2784]
MIKTSWSSTSPRILSLILTLALLFTALPLQSPAFAATPFTDVPSGHWSEPFVNKARDHGLMKGIADGLFGFNRSITRAQFATILYQMFDWELLNPAAPSFTDVPATQWYFPYVETALASNVMDKTETFSPDQPILREDMAAMLVRALGYNTLATKAAQYGHPFVDVTDKAGYITIAYDIGMIKGTSAATFAPKATATREEAATMLVQVYEKYISETNWIHGFYALKSFNQLDLTTQMNAVTAGWSRMSYNTTTGAYLNTTDQNSNEWQVPDGYELVTGFLETNQKPLNLSVYLDTSVTFTQADGTSTNTARAILLDPAQRAQAIQAILSELTRPYDVLGKNPYSGVTIDFEGLRGPEMKAAFTAFLEELKAGLDATGKSLYVMVQPAVWNSAYFDGYDYRAIGSLADRVILMAHDYQPTNLKGFEETTFHKNAALTPLEQVYYSLKMVTDPTNGVATQDQGKLALAISFTNMAWTTSEGLLSNPIPRKIETSTVYARMTSPDAAMGYSEVYRNPYLTYTTETGEEIFLWYEDARSVADKLALAKLFGIRGVSLWRLGQVPAYGDAGLEFDVMQVLK